MFEIYLKKDIVKKCRGILLSFYSHYQRKFSIQNSQWAQWCKPRKSKIEKERVIIESILTQQTNWQNVEKAMFNLKSAKSDNLTVILNTPKKRLEQLIKPAGFYRVKAKYLKNIASYFISRGGVKEVEKEKGELLRKELLAIKGVGKETADSILLYALRKKFFVIDAYIKKLVKDLKLPVEKFSYDYLQKFFIKIIPSDIDFYQKFHAIIVIYYKNNKLKK